MKTKICKRYSGEDKYGSTRDLVEFECDNCTGIAVKPSKDLGETNFCSITCRCLYVQKRKSERCTKVNCHFCNTELLRTQKSVRNSRYGVFYCSRICKDKDQQYLLRLDPEKFAERRIRGRRMFLALSRGLSNARAKSVVGKRANQKLKVDALLKRGAELVAQENPWFLLLVGLYWGEGGKGNYLAITNQDAGLISTFYHAYTRCGFPNAGVVLTVRVSNRNADNLEDFKNWWAVRLNLPKENIRGSIDTRIPKTSVNNKQEYHGCAVLYVRCSTDTRRIIAGGIEALMKKAPAHGEPALSDLFSENGSNI